MSRELSTPFGRCLLLTSRRPFPEQDPVILHLRVPRNKTFLSLFVFPEGGELGLHYNYWLTDVLAKRCGFFLVGEFEISTGTKFGEMVSFLYALTMERYMCSWRFFFSC